MNIHQNVIIMLLMVISSIISGTMCSNYTRGSISVIGNTIIIISKLSCAQTMHMNVFVAI